MPDYEIIIAEGTLTSTATSINITSIPATYSHLELFVNSRSTKSSSDSAGGNLNVNGITSNSYGQIGTYINNSVTPTIYNLTGSGGVYTRNQIDNAIRIMNDGMPANAYATCKIVMPNYSNTTISSKGFLIQNCTSSTNTSTYWELITSGFVVTSAAINRIELFSNSTSYPFKTGTSYYLAGWK